MKKALTSIFIFCVLTGSLYSQFETIRGVYSLPIHTGVLLDSAVLPLHNFKTTILDYNSTDNTWTIASETFTEREGGKIKKQSTIRFLSDERNIVSIIEFHFENQGIVNIISSFKPYNSNDTSLSTIDTFIYKNNLLVERKVINKLLVFGTTYLYDSLNRLIETGIVEYDSSSLKNITFTGYFKVDSFYQYNKPQKVSLIEISFDPNGNKTLNKSSEVYYYHDDAGRIISWSQYIFHPFFDDYLLTDSIYIFYNAYGNPERIETRSGSVNPLPREIITYNYNSDNVLTEIIESTPFVQYKSKKVYTSIPATSINKPESKNISFKTFPNPTASAFQVISGSELINIESVSVYNLAGSKLYTTQYNNQNIDINLPDGYYIIEINTSMGTYFEKLMVKKF